jgi:hypothetical protein
MAKTVLLPIYIRRHIKNNMASMRLPSVMAILQKFAILEIIRIPVQFALCEIQFSSVPKFHFILI